MLKWYQKINRKHADTKIAIHLLEMKNFKLALIASKELEKIEVGEEDIYEKILLKFWKQLSI